MIFRPFCPNSHNFSNVQGMEIIGTLIQRKWQVELLFNLTSISDLLLFNIIGDKLRLWFVY